MRRGSQVPALVEGFLTRTRLTLEPNHEEVDAACSTAVASPRLMWDSCPRCPVLSMRSEESGASVLPMYAVAAQ